MRDGRSPGVVDGRGSVAAMNSAEVLGVGCGRGRHDMEELESFRRELTDTYGHYAEVKAAISFFREQLDEWYGAHFGQDNPVMFGSGDPNGTHASYAYRSTFSELVAGLGPNGRRLAVHSRSVIVLVVALWEASYRGRIADELGLEDKNDLKSEVFRDLNKYRQAILHAGAVLREEPRELRIFRKGEQVILTSEHMDLIFRTIIDELNRMGEEHYGRNPNFRFYVPLHDW